MSDSVNWLNRFHEGRDRASAIVWELHAKANALRIVGMMALAEDLDAFAYEIEQGVGMMNDAVNENIINEFDKSQKAMSNTLVAILGNLK